jgi:hypothetical protein
VIPLPERDYLAKIGEVAYAIGYLEWSVLGDLSRVESACRRSSPSVRWQDARRGESRAPSSGTWTPSPTIQFVRGFALEPHTWELSLTSGTICFTPGPPQSTASRHSSDGDKPTATLTRSQSRFTGSMTSSSGSTPHKQR